MALPDYLIKSAPKLKNIRRIREMIEDSGVHTICESALCPNIGECFSKNTLTFMILGDTCTRRCLFCAVNKGAPTPPDPAEPQRIASAAQKLGLDYIVITSVTRDDRSDGGAAQFAAVIKKLRPRRTEVLVPDFGGDEEALKTVLAENPYVLNHNMETVARLYPFIRPEASYRRSLNLLYCAKKINPAVYTKSGFMLGLGETREEVFSALRDLRLSGCDVVTIGQYLAPSKKHPAPERYLPPEEFEAYKTLGENLGFLKVMSGSFVRSSYQAKDFF